MVNLTELSLAEKLSLVEQIFSEERDKILKDALQISSWSLDKLVEFTSSSFNNFMDNRNPFVLSVFRGLRKESQDWNYAEGIALETVYNVAVVGF
jgi:hypothetical protein